MGLAAKQTLQERCAKYGITLEIGKNSVTAHFGAAYIMYVADGVTISGKPTYQCSHVIYGQTVHSWRCATYDPKAACVKAAVKEVRYAQQL